MNTLENKTKHPMDIINLIGDNSGKSYKQDVLKSFHDNIDFVKALKYTYDPKKSYGVKKLGKTLDDIIEDAEAPCGSGGQRQRELNMMFGVLDNLDFGNLGGNQAIHEITGLMRNVSEKTAELMYWIIKRDLKCGIDAKSIYRALGIRLKPAYMGAIVYDPKKIKKLLAASPTGYVYAQNKADGAYGAIVMNHGAGRFYVESRAGHYIHGLDRLLDDVYNKGPKTRDYVITGEIMVEGYDRFTANGIVNSLKSLGGKIDDGTVSDGDYAEFELSHGKSYYSMQKLVHMLTWDTITLDEYTQGKSSVPMETRLADTEELCKDIKSVNMVNYIKATTYEEICEFFADQLSQGLEGVIVKSCDGGWKDGKSPHQIKMKLEFVSDLKIVGFSEGEVDSKYQGSLGALCCESENGKLVTKVSGMSDDERWNIWNNKESYLGRIIEVKCNGLSKPRNSDIHSMMYAVAYKVKGKMQFRDDKLDANSLAEIQAIENSKKYGK